MTGVSAVNRKFSERFTWGREEVKDYLRQDGCVGMFLFLL